MMNTSHVEFVKCGKNDFLKLYIILLLEIRMIELNPQKQVVLEYYLLSK